MANSLPPCVATILCGLSSAALNALQTIINGQIALLQAQIAIYQAQILQYDILAIPVEATRAAAQTILDKVKQSSTLIPINIIASCVPIGDFKVNLMESLNAATSAIDDVAFEAIRLLSFRDDLNAIVAQMNIMIVQFTDIRDVIKACPQV